MATGELQFRCKLCQFTGSDKGEIAEHFLNEHIEVEYVSPNKKALTTPTQTMEEEEVTKKERESSLNETQAPRKRGRPKGKSNLSIKKLTIVTPEPTVSEIKEALGRGMRKRKKKTPMDTITDEEDNTEESADEEDGDDEDIDEDPSEESDDYHEEVHESERTAVGKRKMITIKPLKGSARRCGKPRKKGRGRDHKEDQRWKVNDSLATRKGGKVRLNLAVPIRVYSKILRDRVKEWQKIFDRKSNLDMFRCSNDTCHGAMHEAEYDVHTKCHVPNMEGFRCFICQFVCLHWRNMRHHYRKVHDQMLTKVTCDFENCHKEFPRLAALRSHVTMIHIKPLLIERLGSKNLDLSDFASYMSGHKLVDKQIPGIQNGGDHDQLPKQPEDEEEEEENDDERPKKRGPGRPPKRKRPVGRPSKNPEPTHRRPTYYKRLRGEDRERLQSRLVAFVCDVCHAKYNEEEVMMTHKYAHYREDRDELHCTECENFVTTDEASIQLHMATEHKNMLQLHRCGKCNFSSNRYHDLKKHHIVHTGAKNYMCDKCGKCTTTPYNLKVHYRRMHATDEEKNIKCISCEYRCADKAVLKDHIRQKHGLLINGDEYQNPRAMLLYSCTQCDYVGRKQSSLDYHMRIHNENRQFKCHLCPYASKTKNNLVLHIRTHDGLQPVKCPHCDFRGATNKIISEHVMCKHAGTRPYQCTICGWSTAYSGNMWKHVDTHQKELGDKMPEFPVNVVSTDGHSVPTPLRAPSGKKRGSGKKASNFKLKLMKGKNRRHRLTDQPNTLSILENQDNVHTMHVSQTQAGNVAQDGVVLQQVHHVQQVPVSSVMQHPDHILITEGMTEEEAIGSTALSKLAAAVASAHEVHIISTGHQGIDAANVEQAQQIIATQIAGHVPTSVQIATSSGIQEIVEYTVPSVTVTQQIDDSGNMTHVISDHLYHAQHNHEQQQQQQLHHQQQHANGGSIQQAAIHAGIPTGVEQVPAAVVEQIVQDSPHHEEQAVQHLVATMIPHDAELVMSMMQAHVQQVQQVQHLQQPNISQ